jgi:hypothetical protein
VKNSHTYGDAVTNLFEDDGARSIGDIAVDFDPAIDGTRMHDDCIGLHPRSAFSI